MKPFFPWFGSRSNQDYLKPNMSFADEIWENSYIKPNENGNGTRNHVFDADGVGVWKNGRCELIWDKMLWDTRAMDCGVWWSIRSLNLQQVLQTITSIVNCVSIGLHELTLSNKSRSILNQDPKIHSIVLLDRNLLFFFFFPL